MRTERHQLFCTTLAPTSENLGAKEEVVKEGEEVCTASCCCLCCYCRGAGVGVVGGAGGAVYCMVCGNTKRSWHRAFILSGPANLFLPPLPQRYLILHSPN